MKQEANAFAGKLVKKLNELLPDDEDEISIIVEGLLAKIFRLIKTSRRLLAATDLEFSTDVFEGTKAPSKLKVPSDHQIVAASEVA